jgi:hypothetical protein
MWDTKEHARTRMQVPPRPRDRKLEIHEPSQAIGERGRACVKPIIVALRKAWKMRTEPKKTYQTALTIQTQSTPLNHPSLSLSPPSPQSTSQD